MARTRGNTALLEQDGLTPDEQKIMDEDKQAQFELSEPDTSEPKPETPPEPKPDEQPKPDEAAKPEAPKDGEPQPAAADAKTPDGKQRTVDYGAFHEERERRREERQRREKAESELAALTGRFKTLEDLARAAAQEVQPQFQMPDVNTHPVEHFQTQIALRDARIAQFEQWQRDQVRLQQEAQTVNAIRNRAVAGEQEFAKANPDYLEAADFVQAARHRMLDALGYRDPMQRQQQLAMEALNMANEALQQGENPAQRIWNVALAMGWQPKAKANGSAGTATGAPAVAPDQAGAKKLETVAKGQQANTSIGKMSGQGTPPKKPELEDLLKMSEEEFDKITSKPGAWKELMGGN